MTAFRCIPIATEAADSFRLTRQDHHGNNVKIFNSERGGLPCRRCLNETAGGEDVLLGSYSLLRPGGVYWTPSPIFVHTGQCRRYDAVDHIPDIVRRRLVSLRAYGEDDMVLYDLGVISDGRAIDAPLQHILADARCSYVNIHTAKPGCMLCRVERD